MVTASKTLELFCSKGIFSGFSSLSVTFSTRKVSLCVLFITLSVELNDVEFAVRTFIMNSVKHMDPTPYVNIYI